MVELYPNDTAGFTAHLWKINCPVCGGAGRVEVSEVEAYYERFV